MTVNSADERTLSEPITDLDSLRDRHEVPHSVETEVVDGDTVETIERLENLAVVGVTNDRGAVLLLRVTEDCELKPPTPSVAPDEDYVTTARDWVESQAGFPITLEAVEELWEYEVQLENGTRSASRSFVVFSAVPADDAVDRALADPVGGAAAEAGWYDEFPDEAVEPPGTDRFFG